LVLLVSVESAIEGRKRRGSPNQTALSGRLSGERFEMAIFTKILEQLANLRTESFQGEQNIEEKYCCFSRLEYCG